MGSREREARLTRAVADAADAWLRDPRDVGVYQRLVDAVTVLRAYRAGAMVRSEVGEGALETTQPEELLDEFAGDQPATAVGELLAGEPRDVVARLREAAGGGRAPTVGDPS